MSLSEVLFEARALSRPDKLRLIQLVAQELEQDESSQIELNQSYPIWSPSEAFSAAAVMLESLDSESKRP